MLGKCVSGNQFSDLPPVGFAPSELADDRLRRSADFNPVLSGKHASAPPKKIDFTPYAYVRDHVLGGGPDPPRERSNFGVVPH